MSARSLTLFASSRAIVTADRETVAVQACALCEQGEPRVLAFDDLTGEQVDLGSHVGPREKEERSGPGRPKLGVVAREVTLLPRHWEWLSAQPGGASVALRKLVDAARRENAGSDRRRQSQEAAFRFMTAIAGDEPGYEEACRALYAADSERFEAIVASWPADVATYVTRLAEDAFVSAE